MPFEGSVQVDGQKTFFFPSKKLGIVFLSFSLSLLAAFLKEERLRVLSS